MTIPDVDLALLRRFEPVLKFTHGELFFPMATGPFVEACDLLEGPTLREASVAIPSGTLDLDRLGAVDDPPPGHSQYLRFVPKPLSAVELARWRNRADAPRFDAPGRLARVGLAARLVDAGHAFQIEDAVRFLNREQSFFEHQFPDGFACLQ